MSSISMVVLPPDGPTHIGKRRRHLIVAIGTSEVAAGNRSNLGAAHPEGGGLTEPDEWLTADRVKGVDDRTVTNR
jgi:hypothetical protein